MAAGVARNSKVMMNRLRQFKARLPRYRMLKLAGVNTAMLVRTGGTAALMHGYMALGVPPSVLLQQRRAVNAATAPISGLGGQELDLALMVADGSPKGKADAAFAAHTDVLQHWAKAIWNRWVPVHKLQAALDDAWTRMAKCPQPWRIVYGPAAALICTAKRLNWEVINATELLTDTGRTLYLTLDPPIVVARLSDEAVRRWRWRNVSQIHPSLPESGANLNPLYKLLNAKTTNDDWNPHLIGALKSVLAGRQHTQQRAHRNNWVDHAKCIFCLHASVTGQPHVASMPKLSKPSKANQAQHIEHKSDTDSTTHTTTTGLHHDPQHTSEPATTNTPPLTKVPPPTRFRRPHLAR